MIRFTLLGQFQYEMNAFCSGFYDRVVIENVCVTTSLIIFSHGLISTYEVLYLLCAKDTYLGTCMYVDETTGRSGGVPRRWEEWV